MMLICLALKGLIAVAVFVATKAYDWKSSVTD